jgi:Domain of unknown function (DUF4062)
MKVFISSTFCDLQRYRAAVADAIERLGIQLSRMEAFGARPEEPSRACLDEVEASDLFVGIYAHRYGFVPDGSTVSITEAEFDRATKLRRPTFCFLVDNEYTWDETLIEGDPGRTRLDALKARIGSLVVRDIFTTSEVLATRVATAIGRYLIADPRRSGAASVDNFARNSIADGATAVFVDVMRLACVSGSPSAKRVNEPRYPEFVDIADQHLSDFRGQIARLSSDRDAEFPRRCAEVESDLAWAVTRLRRTTVLGTPWREFVQILRKLAGRVDALAAMASPDYYAARVDEVASIVKREGFTLLPASLQDPDLFVHRRFATQSEVINWLKHTAALAIATVRDDMDRVLAIPYFTIDHHLLRMVTDGR